MSNTIISVENISKQYRLGMVGTKTLNHDFNRWWHKIRGKEDPYLKIGESNDRTKVGNSDYVWALQDINFEVKQGEVLGIIGRNGAGKSTLLKILSKVTQPTTGQIKVKGRIASLLEVGTGFHPELSGRENIYLNGAILGMTKKEISSKFDEIVDFAGVERYIDTPVKRYSSGMYVRLAFGVAAHLEPEILIVDEVLAVGDAEFQKKCLGKMKDVSVNDGRTVLFVSHNLAAVNQLCTNGIVLANGKFAYAGGQRDAVSFYQSSGNAEGMYRFIGNDIENAPGNNCVRILQFGVKPTIGNEIYVDSDFVFELTFHFFKININFDVTFEMSRVDEIVIFHQGIVVTSNKDSKNGVYNITGKIPGGLLNSGIYKFSLIFGEDQRYLLYKKEDFIQFEIVNQVNEGSNTNQLPGVLKYNIPFSLKFTNNESSETD